MAASRVSKIIPDDKGNEQVMIRVDKTLKAMMEEKPSSRWDPDYWHPKYDELFRELSKFPTELLDNFRSEITSGYRSGGVTYSKSGVMYLQVRNILDTGLDLVDVDLIPVDSPAKTSSKKVNIGDILLNRSGTGSVGRMTVFLGSKKECYVGGHVYRFSVKPISPIYVNVLLKTSFCEGQIHRFESGVSGKTELDLEELLHILIPLLSKKVQENIENEYLRMMKFHDKAMEAKKENDITGFRTNIKKAETMLNDLVSKTEAVIRGERKDIS